MMQRQQHQQQQPPQRQQRQQQQHQRSGKQPAKQQVQLKKLPPPAAAVAAAAAEPAAEVVLYCDPCEKEFTSIRARDQHMAAHVKCEQCAFAASGKLVKEHVQARDKMHSGPTTRTCSRALMSTFLRTLADGTGRVVEGLCWCPLSRESSV